MIIRVKATRINPKWDNRLLARLEKIRSKEAAVGFPKGKGLDAPHYTSKRADGSTVAGPSIMDTAIWGNFGTDDSPPRPFMDKATPAIASAWNSQKADIICRVNRDENIDADKELGEAGETAKNIIVLEIDAMTSPPNALTTIKRKRSSHPLIDTGAMKQAVTYAVRTKGRKKDKA